VAETLNLDDSAWILSHNHTSVVGMGPVIKNRSGIIIKSVTMEMVDDYLRLDEMSRKTSLFAYPAQCNFSGVRFNLDWINQFQDRKWLVLLDAASYASTSKLDLKKYPADFVTISFYKLFGYPTGLGALLVKNSSSLFLQKSFIGGGSVSAIAINPFYARPKASISAQLEDGTIPFQQILAIEYGFNYIETRFGSWTAYGEYCNSLVNDALLKMKTFCYPNKSAVFKIFEEDLDINRGPIIAFCLLDEMGQNIGYSQVMKLANAEDIHIRSGRFCNPGAAQTYLDISSEEIKEWKETLGHVCGDSNDQVSQKATGALRISFSYANQPDDITKFLKFIEEYFFTIQKEAALSDNADISLTLQDIIIFPIKSCKGLRVKEWWLGPHGLKYDREFMLVDRSGQILTQKKYSKLNMIEIVALNISTSTMVISAPDNGSITISLNYGDSLDGIKSSVKICGLGVENTLVDSTEIHSWFANYLGTECYLVRHSKHTRSFANNSQYLVVSSSSVEELKRCIAQEKATHVSPLSFRPNFVVNGASPFIEESWVGKEIRIDGILFMVVGLCERCSVINVDDRCIRHKEPLRTLAQRPRINGKIVFGLHLARKSNAEKEILIAVSKK
jgi:molybdenum cofactor sulfurtransferase